MACFGVGQPLALQTAVEHYRECFGAAERCSTPDTAGSDRCVIVVWAACNSGVGYRECFGAAERCRTPDTAGSDRSPTAPSPTPTKSLHTAITTYGH